MGEDLATLNSINDDCFVFKRSGGLWHNHNFYFLGLLTLRRKDRKSHSIQFKCLLISIKLEDLPKIYVLSPAPPPLNLSQQAEIQVHTCHLQTAFCEI